MLLNLDDFLIGRIVFFFKLLYYYGTGIKNKIIN